MFRRHFVVKTKQNKSRRYNKQLLKQKFCLYQSVDCCGPDRGSQATFLDSHKITVLIWPVYFSKGLSTLDA